MWLVEEVERAVALGVDCPKKNHSSGKYDSDKYPERREHNSSKYKEKKKYNKEKVKRYFEENPKAAWNAFAAALSDNDDSDDEHEITPYDGGRIEDKMNGLCFHANSAWRILYHGAG